MTQDISVSATFDPVSTSGVGSTFPIATTTTGEFSVSAAFDGTNYLVGIQNDPSIVSDSISAQLIDQSGNLVGSRIYTGRTGGVPFVAFDGTNYLMVWADDATTSNIIYGQLISKTGKEVDSPFIIGYPSGQGGEPIGVVFDGNNYFVAWDTDDDGDTVDLYGQFVSPSGNLVGSTVAITTAEHQQRDAAVGFDGTSILVVWSDGRRHIQTGTSPCTGNPQYFPTDIYGQFITKSGASTAGALSGSNFIINENSYPNDNPLSIAFDGTNYLIVWDDETTMGTTCVNSDEAGGKWDPFGQLIDKSGNKVVSVINVSTASGHQFVPQIAFDGTNYLVTWTDTRNDINDDGVCDNNEGTCWDVYGQYISKTGSLVGSEFVINNDAGNQFGGVAGFNGGKYLVLINTGATGDPPGCTEGCGIVTEDVYGLFITP